MSSRQQTTVRGIESKTSTTEDPQTTEADEGAANGFDTSSTCEECGGQSFTRSEAGEWYCDSCGLLQTRPELEFSEPGWIPQEERRVGPAASVSRVSIGTRIGTSSDGSKPFWTRYNKRLGHENQTLRHGLKELRALGNALEATEPLIEQAATLFRHVADEGELLGHSLEAMAAACIHVTAREHHVPFPLKQIAEFSPVSLDRIKSAVSKLVREFPVQVVPPLPTMFIPRFASEAGLPNEVRQRAIRISEAIIEDGKHVGQSPTGVAAATLYGAAKECEVAITQEDLASIAFISSVTLSRQWQTVSEYCNNLN